ncbi:MAG: hypothetical protein PF483_10160 [Halothiobacillus sp.]|jgi:hypothetical protein|nr:hypothetical protein [Halothiobacillus sp.]
MQKTNIHLIEAGVLPGKIALYLEPIQPNKDWLATVIRRTTISESHHSDEYMTSNEDVDLLIRIGAEAQITFHDLMTGNCGHDCFDGYMKVFNESPLKPDWTLVPKFNNYEKEAGERRGVIRRAHFKLIEDSAKRGEIKLLTPGRAPTFRIDPGVLISLSDAHKYLDSIGLPTALMENQAQKPQPEETLNEQIFRLSMTGKSDHVIKHTLGLSISTSAIGQRRRRHEMKLKKIKKQSPC